MRTTADECVTIGRCIAGQLNRAIGPTVVVLPLRGVSALDANGKPFYDPNADRALFETLRGSLSPAVRIVELDAHINDPAFAETVSTEMLALLGRVDAVHRT